MVRNADTKQTMKIFTYKLNVCSSFCYALVLLKKIVSDSVLFKDAFLKNVFQWRKLLLSAREIPLES